MGDLCHRRKACGNSKCKQLNTKPALEYSRAGFSCIKAAGCVRIIKKPKEVKPLQTIEQALEKLNTSKFRSSFHLKPKDKEYVKEKGYDVIRSHAEDFIRTRLAPAEISNDGKQTPMKGHPVFIAQHACACCCRGCLFKWYKVKQGTQLSEIQQQKIVNLLMAWIKKEMGD